MTNYNKAFRVLAIVVAVVLWAVSVQFSALGFGIDAKDYIVYGYILALAVTTLELIMNKAGASLPPVLFIACILAYMYGTFTNVEGIWAIQGAKSEFTAWLMPAVLGLFLEIVPEPMILWALSFKGSQITPISTSTALKKDRSIGKDKIRTNGMPTTSQLDLTAGRRSSPRPESSFEDIRRTRQYSGNEDPRYYDSQVLSRATRRVGKGSAVYVPHDGFPVYGVADYDFREM